MEPDRTLWTTQDEISFLRSIPEMQEERREGKPSTLNLLQLYRNYIVAMPSRVNWEAIEKEQVAVEAYKLLRRYQAKAAKEFRQRDMT